MTAAPPKKVWPKREHPLLHPEEAAQTSTALRKGIEWAESLDVNPLRIRSELQMKGIKFYAEYLDLLLLAYEWPADQKLSEDAQQKAMKALEITETEEYHALDARDMSRFKEDSMSYLRVCMLAERLGKETAAYRARIFALREALYGHLPQRGVDNRLSFALLFRQLNFPLAETEEEIHTESLIAAQKPLSYYQTAPDKPYDITHEIFAMTWRGYRPFPFRNSDEERYAKETITALLRKAIDDKNLDLAAEFVVNLAELGEAKSDIVQEARQFLFNGQNPDGSFGDYTKQAIEMKKVRPLYDVRIGGNLHTTMVCLWALVETS
jgi:hypothetical protein